MRISAVIITRNAVADGLERCLVSLAEVDEIVVLDQGSDDGTIALAERCGARVCQGEWRGFGPTKAAAVALATHRWVLSVDADEELTPELRRSLAALAAQATDPTCAAYGINRQSRFLGRWIRHCGWHPDVVVRLFDRERARFDDRAVHEQVVVDGTIGRLDGLLLHHTYRTMEQYIEKLNRYTSLAAEDAVVRGKRATLPGALAHANAAFFRMYFAQLGLLDGWHGLVLCLCSAYYVLAKYVKIWQATRGIATDPRA